MRKPLEVKGIALVPEVGVEPTRPQGAADFESGAFQQLATPLNKKKPTGIGFSERHSSLSCWRKLAVVGR